MNFARKFFSANGTFVAPPGVKYVNVRTIRKDSLKIFGGENHSQRFNFIDANGNLYGFGLNGAGELGDNSVTAKSSPTLVVGGLKFKSFSGGNTTGIDQFGNLYAWGSNTFGQLGDNTVAAKSSPTLVVGGLKWAGTCNQRNSNVWTMGVTESGQLYAWGINASGQLGVNDTTPRSSPTLVVGGLVFDPNQLRLGANGNYGWGITTSGALYMWGLNTNGVLGDGATVTPKSSPTLVVGGLSFQKVTAGTSGGAAAQTAVGLTTSGQVYAWGSNNSGQLGDGTTTTRSSPVLMLGGLTYSDITFGDASSNNASVYLLTTTGDCYAVGANVVGELGNGTVTTAKSSPTLVIGGLKFTKIFCGNNANSKFVLGLTPTGDLYSWGFNGNGQLGDGTTSSRSSPVLVVGGLQWASVSVESNMGSVIGLSTNGKLYAWGLNNFGNLGDGTVVAKSSPTLVLGALTASAQDTVNEIPINVTPGSSYAVVIQQTQAFFGGYSIGNGPVDQVIVEFMQ